MDNVTGALTTVGTLAAVISAWYAFRPKSPRKPSARPSPPSPEMDAPRYDAFIAYPAEEAERAETIARGLQARDCRVFLAAWVGPGLRPVIETDNGLAASASGALLYTRAARRRPKLEAEYARIVEHIHNNGGLFVPVLLEKVQLAGYAASHQPLDLTDPKQDEPNLDLLARSLKRRSAGATS